MLTSMLTAPVARGFARSAAPVAAFGFFVVLEASAVDVGATVVGVVMAGGGVTADATAVGVVVGCSVATGAGACVAGGAVAGTAVVGAAVEGGTMNGGTSTVSADTGTLNPAATAKPTRATAPHRSPDLVLPAFRRDRGSGVDRTTSRCVVPSGTAVREVRSSRRMRTVQIVCARSALRQAWFDEIGAKQFRCSRERGAQF